MGRRVQLREVTNEERQAVARLAPARLAPARTAPARGVERARVVLAALDGQRVEEIAAEQQLSRNTVYRWVHRFEQRGLEGLEDQTRSGRPRTSPGEPAGAIVATALTKPTTLGLPYASWTLDRLAASLSEQKGSAMRRSRLGEVLLEVLLSEGLRWRKAQTWFGERVDPDFAAKRGR